MHVDWMPWVLLALLLAVVLLQLLHWFQPRPQPADLDLLAQQIVALSRFAVACGDTLESVDINPFMALPASRGGGCAVDAVVIGRAPDEQEPA